MNTGDLIRAEGRRAAESVVGHALVENGGLLPLLYALGTAHSVGLEQGLLLAIHHPDLGRRLLEAIDREGYPDAPRDELDEQRAQFLIRMVEGMNS